MHELVADRFVALGHTWIDIASGTPVRLRFSAVPDAADAILRLDHCAERARLRHPLMNVLVDYGMADCSRMFEAYSAGKPIRTSSQAGLELLQHAGRFLASRGLALSPHASAATLRQVVPPSTRFDRPRATRTHAASVPFRSRPLGVVLQPRGVLESLAEAMEVATPGGTTSIQIAGVRGSGLRTSRLLAARTARVGGLVPISSAVLIRLPWLRERLAGRHLCLLLEDHGLLERSEVALFLAQLGTASARRHVILRFTRTEAPIPGALQVDSMGITAMTSMVFVDGDKGPSHDELFDAARLAGGCPGLFLDRLRAALLGEPTTRISLVHESSPTYTYRAPLSPTGGRTRPRRLGRVLNDARARAVTLAARGRHASAVRLLTRASRVFEGRNEFQLAAACAEQLAWLARDRGMSDGALDQFERARALSARVAAAEGPDACAIAATIGIGIVRTDQRRMPEAEASLRGACAAADLLGPVRLQKRARLGLVRCLYWQTRYDEALVELTPWAATTAPDRGDDSDADALALLARCRAATGDVRGAVAAAGEAVTVAGRIESPRAAAAAFRSMAIAQELIGDLAQVRQASDRAWQAASAAHLPLAGLRARSLFAGAALRAVGERALDGGARRCLSHLRAALRRQRLPALLRGEIEAVCATSTPPIAGRARTATSDAALQELEIALNIAHSASDDESALEAVCEHACDRLRAASVQIVGAGAGARALARAGRPWPGDPGLVARVLAGGAAGTGAGVPPADEPRQAAEPIRFGREAIAVLSCRWTTGTPVDPERAAAILRAMALAVGAPVRNVLDRPLLLEAEPGFGELLGSSEAAAALRAAVLRAARAPFPVLVEGESGSGKELVARAVHRFGSRRERRLCTVNCAALSDDLLEAELFGHTRGAFTGAVGERAGLFEEADGGTVFLDEVGELSARAQAKLLRVLQDGEVRRVGENLPRRIDARVVAATNRRLEDEVAANRFRADLRFRLDVVRIVVPPLRERSSDVPALAAHFWVAAAGRVGTAATLTADTLAALARYDWPGNVRELQNVIASLAVHAPRRGRILPAVLPAHIAKGARTGAATFESARHEFERRFVRAALAQAGGQRSRAARTLGLSRQGLAKMLRRLGLDKQAGPA